MTNKTIGHAPCPCCGKTADVRETKKGKSYLMCDDCGCQLFARGFDADKHLRQKMQPIETEQKPQEKTDISDGEAVKQDDKAVAESTIFDTLGSLIAGANHE